MTSLQTVTGGAAKASAAAVPAAVRAPPARSMRRTGLVQDASRVQVPVAKSAGSQSDTATVTEAQPLEAEAASASIPAVPATCQDAPAAMPLVWAWSVTAAPVRSSGCP